MDAAAELDEELFEETFKVINLEFLNRKDIIRFIKKSPTFDSLESQDHYVKTPLKIMSGDEDLGARIL